MNRNTENDNFKKKSILLQFFYIIHAEVNIIKYLILLSFLWANFQKTFQKIKFSTPFPDK